MYKCAIEKLSIKPKLKKDYRKENKQPDEGKLFESE